MKKLEKMPPPPPPLNLESQDMSERRACATFAKNNKNTGTLRI